MTPEERQRLRYWLVFDGLEKGNLRPLRAFLRKGYPLDEEMRNELAGAIERGFIGSGPAVSPDAKAKATKGAADRARKLRIGAYLAVCNHLSPRANYARAKKWVAEEKFHVSQGTAHAYRLYYRRRAKPSDDLGAYLAWWNALREACADHDLDYYEVHSGLYSDKKRPLKF